MRATNERTQCGACIYEAMAFIVMSPSAHAESCSHYRPPDDGDTLSCKAVRSPMELLEVGPPKTGER